MSLSEILETLDQLSPGELILVQDKLNLIQQDFSETPSLLAAIEEGIRSADEGPLTPLNDVIQEMRMWNTKSS